jgi:D-threo-aldose 1-dehydrogenase
MTGVVLRPGSTGRRLAELLKPVMIGASTLGERPGADVLARAMVSSTVGQVDTSNNYAAGKSERYLGRALREGSVESTFINSKADADPVTGRFDYSRVMRSFEESCERLGCAYLPMYFLHDPDESAFADTMRPGGAVEALTELRSEGIVGAIGIAAGGLKMVEAYVETDVFDAVLNHNRWTMIDRSADELWSKAHARQMAIFNAAPFGGGILAGSTTRGSSYGYRPASNDVLTYVGSLHSLAKEHSVDLAAAALQWAGRDERVDTVIVGVSSTQRLDQLEELQRSRVPVEFWDDVDRLGTPPLTGLDA